VSHRLSVRSGRGCWTGERYGGPTEPVQERSYAGEDWYGEQMAGRAFVRCRFADVDLTEATCAAATFPPWIHGPATSPGPSSMPIRPW